MVDIGRAFLGATAGAAGAIGEVYKEKRSSSESDRKQAVIAKRDKTLASFRNELSQGRDKTQFEGQKELAGMRIEGQKEIAKQTDARWASRYGAKADKGKSPAEQKMMRENAINDLRAGASALGGFYNKETNDIGIPLAEVDETEIKKLKALVKDKGFNPTFVEQDGELLINLGGFNPKKVTKALAAPAEDKAKSAFDTLYDALSTTPGSKMNDEQPDDGLRSSHGLAAPTQYSIDNSQRQ
jgi:hypothetical protein